MALSPSPLSAAQTNAIALVVFGVAMVAADVPLVPCGSECRGHGWEVIQGFQHTPESEFDDASTGDGGEVLVDSAGIEREYEGYSDIFTFGGYTSTGLCAKWKRSKPIDGHTNCSLESNGTVLWPPKVVKGKEVCFVDNIKAYQDGQKLRDAPDMEVRLGKCPPDESNTWRDLYDWRYGGIRPDDTEDEELYPELVRAIEAANARTGKKAVIRGCSGGTIASYSFLMSQTVEWRQKNIMAWVIVCPVLGGTVSSIVSILAGWVGGALDRCVGRFAAEMIPSVPWMWPRKGLWLNTEPLIITPKQNYTAYDFERMLFEMGLPKTRDLLALERGDDLGEFRPPMVDTYAFYGYGVPTQAGFILPRNLTPATDGSNICPPSANQAFMREADNGDRVAPRRSGSRAAVWTDAHKEAGVVLENYGYENMGHSCSCTVDKCKSDYAALMAKLKGDGTSRKSDKGTQQTPARGTI